MTPYRFAHAIALHLIGYAPAPSWFDRRVGLCKNYALATGNANRVAQRLGFNDPYPFGGWGHLYAKEKRLGTLYDNPQRFRWLLTRACCGRGLFTSREELDEWLALDPQLLHYSDGLDAWKLQRCI